MQDRFLKQRIHKWLQECSSDCKCMTEKYVYLRKMKRTPVDLVHRGRNTFSFTVMPHCKEGLFSQLAL